MTDFLLLLGKLNLAMGAAIIVVWLLRRPLRAWFGAPVAYALWLLVPIAGIASLLPPRVAAPLPAYVMHLQNPAVQNLAGQYRAARSAQPGTIDGTHRACAVDDLGQNGFP
jgi:beta-lactamase regulating signal transducer with metallopeptidase domain